MGAVCPPRLLLLRVVKCGLQPHESHMVVRTCHCFMFDYSTRRRMCLWRFSGCFLYHHIIIIIIF